MNYRTGGPRSFNTVKRSNRAERRRRLRQCDQTLVSIFVILLLLIVSAFILLVCNVAVEFQNRNQTTEEGELIPDAPNLPASYVESSNEYHYRMGGDGNLVVVNGNHSYLMNGELIVPDDLKELKSSTTYKVSDQKKQYLRAFVVEKLDALLNAFYQQTGGVQLTVYDTYRDKDQQKQQGSSGVGYSEHHTGLLVWFKEPNPSELAALNGMCYQYGFIQRYPKYEKDVTGVPDYEECFRYVGVAHATYIYNYNKNKSDAEKLCWEEYIELLRSEHRFQDDHLRVDVNGDNVADYEIYYVPKNETGDSVKIPVPVGMDYTASGDNIGGVIVTVTLNS